MVEWRLWPHPFSTARELWLAEENAQRDAQHQTQRQLEQEERRLDASRRTLASSEQARSAGARMRNRHDGDARSMGADVRAQNAERAHAASSRRAARQLGEVREALDQLEVHDEAGQTLFFRSEPCPRQTVVQFEGLVLGKQVEIGRAHV